MNAQKHFLGSNIQHFRELTKLNKEQLAEVVNSTGAQIGLLERDKIQNPSYFLLEPIANYFGIDVGRFVREDMRNVSFFELAFLRAEQIRGEIDPINYEHFFGTIDSIYRSKVKERHFCSHNRQIPKSSSKKKVSS